MKLSKLKPRALNNGFTLIELIVVISVISILSTIGIVSFVNYDRAQQLSGSVSNIVNLLNQAKSNSLSQVKPDACVLQEAQGVVLDGYVVEVSSAQNTLTLKFKCSNDVGLIIDEPPVKSLILPQNIKIASVVPSDGIFFYPIFSENLTFSGSVTKGTICLDSYGSPAKSITVSELGIVEIGDPC